MYDRNEMIARKITAEGYYLYNAIEAAGDEGCTRKSLSEKLGKALNKWSLVQLQRLIDFELVSVELRRIPGRTIDEYVYRVVV